MQQAVQISTLLLLLFGSAANRCVSSSFTGARECISRLFLINNEIQLTLHHTMSAMPLEHQDKFTGWQKTLLLHTNLYISPNGPSLPGSLQVFSSLPSPPFVTSFKHGNPLLPPRATEQPIIWGSTKNASADVPPIGKLSCNCWSTKQDNCCQTTWDIASNMQIFVISIINT